MKKVLFLIILSMVFSTTNIYSLPIQFDYDSIRIQFQEYLKLKESGIKKIFCDRSFERKFLHTQSKYGIDSLKVSEMDTTNLKSKIIAYATVYTKYNRNDTVFCSIKIDYKLFPSRVVFFKNDEPLAVMDKISNGFMISKPLPIEKYETIDINSADQIIIDICNLDITLVFNVSTHEFSFFGANQYTPSEFLYESGRLYHGLREGIPENVECKIIDYLSYPPEIENNYIK